MKACTDPTHAAAPAAPGWHEAWRRAWRTLHGSMSAVGALTVALALLLAGHPSLRADVEQAVTTWLLQRQGDADEGAETGSDDPGRSATETSGKLPPEQARMADWLARKYRVAAEPLAVLVAEAHAVGRQLGVEPALLLAVMAQESRFNPLAASPWGAQGLMQVLTRAHLDKFEPHGGPQAAFDPVSNLRVGAQVLRESIARAGGSVPGGLRLYVGAITVDASDYISRVLSEKERLKRVAAGQRVPFNAVVPIPALTPPPAQDASVEARAQPSSSDTAQQPS
ncbi:Membrane-bound lytic murein transglycosylase C [Tepidimonas alkaliphilus]|uniref:Membrane-bound lytic murein transglycosylase C n=1 Tax=Tepidimonas alkaliphilus TaxID=2588942 RepID=A0A554W6P9_9BURK|nr:lytic transglycosylase domain-containing protein [Tepidimonas alkaliphilus]TSE19253.1 Membrane-bound lytic murein transglycosylase C [Tepidimonas alkaliphilus]